MHRRADANSRPDGDRARQRDPCVCACICLRRRALSATFDLPLLLRAAALTRTNETRGSTENRRDEDGAKRAIRATCFRPIRFHAWRETGAADILSPLSSPIFTCLSFYLPLRPPVSSLSVVAAASALQYIYIYISSGKYESLSMFDLAGVGLKKKGDRGEE